ncbi:HoxN/HupN/NixA family nickel/cobalt transporter (plasmid) [Microvirga terrae]|uniref:Nickel/cobalt efflux system n=1 Tax=Microvirga terrae TaxID=2740529 RepID=A0ABY5RZ56_9HYPH|nr:HoxN/HupN/NixA family nickel/cobalt transporter [Microvirga terrae]UVF22535.1 HoxN/HupN/NixA family nickel/cobalt transporter [Microvirga terrae]
MYAAQRFRVAALYLTLAVLNVGAWLWALVVFWDNPSLLGVASVVYMLGLRHAVDADHIAAIDNATRQLVQNGQRPVATGFFFAVGHSALIVVVSILAAYAAATLEIFDSYRSLGEAVSTSVTITFLAGIAVLNAAILASTLKAYRRMKSGHGGSREQLEALLIGGGLFSRMFRPLFRFVNKSWHMMPVGFLFALSFDTATEIAIFGISATHAAQGLQPSLIVIFPILFAAGMSLVDATEGLLMLKVYDWAFIDPTRKIRYNLVVTSVSVVLAVFIATIQVVSIIGDKLSVHGPFWDTVYGLGDNFEVLGMLVIVLFLIIWAISLANARRAKPITVQD